MHRPWNPPPAKIQPNRCGWVAATFLKKFVTYRLSVLKIIFFDKNSLIFPIFLIQFLFNVNLTHALFLSHLSYSWRTWAIWRVCWKANVFIDTRTLSKLFCALQNSLYFDKSIVFLCVCLGKLAKVIKFCGKILKKIKNLIFLSIIEHVRKKQCVKSKPWKDAEVICNH